MMTEFKGIKKSFQCTICGKGFGRREHLKRHALSHAEKKDLLCRHCRKGFVRLDALQRHEATHNNPLSLLQRGARACIRCAAAKSRCSGEQPCSRCTARELVCEYPSIAAQHGNSSISNGVIHSEPRLGGKKLLSTKTQDAAISHDRCDNMAVRQPARIGNVDGHAGMLTIDNMEEIRSPTETQLRHLDYYGLSSWTTKPQPVTFQECQLQQLPLLATTTTNLIPWALPPGAASSVPLRTDISPPASLTNGDAISQESDHNHADGEPACLAQGRREQPYFQHSLAVSATAPAIASLPIVNIAISTTSYAELQVWYQEICIDPQDVWTPFVNAELAHPRIFDHLIYLYFKHFDRTLPFIHPEDIFTTPYTALLILALSALGSHYIERSLVPSNFAGSLQEFLDRVLETHFGGSHVDVLDDEAIARVRLLHAVGYTYSGDKRLTRQAPDSSRILAAIHQSARNNLTKQAAHATGFIYNTDLQKRWTTWRARESSLRLAYAAWLLDFMWKYHFGTQPSLTISHATLSLPCSSRLWYTDTAQAWYKLHKQELAASTPLVNILSELYIYKAITTTLSDDANILLMHGILRRSFEVEGYYSSQFSSHENIAEPPQSSDIHPPTPVWLAPVPTLIKWHNLASDALDLLYCQAHATSGGEMLHLHVARMILLVPCSSIVSMVEARVSGQPVSNLDQHLRQWVTEHRVKARLAIVHASATYRHIRHHSTDAFYEAPTVGLAALTLWAYATFANHKDASAAPTVSGNELPGQPDNDEDTSNAVIILDRPTDDELVQQFVKSTRNVRAHLSGIGDLNEDGAALKILQQGCGLLRSLTCWGVNATWLDLLQKLVVSYG